MIEDDYDSEYRYDTKPVPPLYALEGGANVVYLGTVSKTLSPTLRIGYLVRAPGIATLVRRGQADHGQAHASGGAASACHDAGERCL